MRTTRRAGGLSRRRVLAGCAALVLPAPAARAASSPPRFSAAPPGPDLPAGWAHETLPKVERPNQYAVVMDGGVAVLHVRSRAGASSLIAPVDTGRPTNQLAWRWKVSAALAGSDLRSKAGDDYAARLYVLFDLPLDRLSFGDRVRLQAARSLAGRDIPAAAICYVWGSAQPAGTIGPNPYTDRVQMVVVDSGSERAGQWRSARRDLARDWQQAFGGPMPPVRAVAVGADTDNTGGSADAWFGDVELSAG